MTSRRLFVLVALLGLVFNVYAFSMHNIDYDSDEDKEDSAEDSACNPAVCQPPNCSCFSLKPPNSLETGDVPQFVMLTFDDAVTVANVETYKTIANGQRKNKGNNCPIGLTFFVCHEYNDYKLTNDLYAKGHEIAVHSITHESNTDLWKTSNQTRWEKEMAGMKTILNEFGKIPETSILGHRAPFLQTAGDVTFAMLKEKGFLYDSSLPTRNYMDHPLWPYTLDHGFPQDCQIQPCPKSKFPGLWVVPMVQLKRIAIVKGVKTVFHCSMADACTPYPETAEDTKKYLMNNFNRHYGTNRAPFPLFLHEAWLRDENRLQGYLDFLDTILQNDDVFVVSVQEVVNYMKDPVSVSEYRNRQCFSETRPQPESCSQTANCEYPRRNRFMRACGTCPRRYPWLDNPFGKKQQKQT